jgi:hypothetical protein
VRVFATVYQFSRMLARLSTDSSMAGKTAAAAAAALMSGQMRVVWLDANMQRAFCVHHFMENGEEYIRGGEVEF